MRTSTQMRLLLSGETFCFLNLFVQPEEKLIMTLETETKTERGTTSAFIPTMKPPGAVGGDTLDKQSHYVRSLNALLFG